MQRQISNFLNVTSESGAVAQLVECLPSMQEALSWIPWAHMNQDDPFHSSTCEVNEGESEA